jgi:acetyl esterase/lipase
VRICHSCFDDLSIKNGCPSASISSTDAALTCFLCNESPHDKLSSLIEGRIKGQDLIYWHSSCMSCSSCQKLLKFHEAFIYPVPSHSVNSDQQRPQCFCETHVPKLDALNLATDESLLPPLATNEGADTLSDLKHSATSIPSTPANPFQPLRVCYGTHPNTQYFLLHIPRERVHKRNDLIESRKSIPLVVILHGGFWKSKYSVTNSCVDNLPNFFMSAGIAVCVVEYRRVHAEDPEDEGGWPETGEDILLALQRLHVEIIRLNQEVEDHSTTRRALIDLDRIVLLGHSAGGQLALWACCEPQLTALPFRPAMCVGIAPVANLIQGYQLRYLPHPSPTPLTSDRLSDEGDAVENFMKIPFDPENSVSVAAYHSACPSKLLPLLVPTILVTGTNDTDVPHRLVEDFYWYAKRISGEIISRCVSLSSALPPPPSSPYIRSPEVLSGGEADTTKLNRLASSEQISIDLLDPKIIEFFRTSPPPLKLLKLPGSTHYDVMDSTSLAWGSIFDEILSMSPQLSDVPEIDLQGYRENLESQADAPTVSVSEEQKQSDSMDPLRVGSLSVPSSPARPSPQGSSTSPRTPTSSTHSLAMGYPTPIKAVDYIWVCHVRSLQSLKGPNYHNLHSRGDNDNDDLLSDTSSDDNGPRHSRSSKSKSRPDPGAAKVNTSRDSTASREPTTSPTGEHPSEFFSFPAPKNDRTANTRFKFPF